MTEPPRSPLHSTRIGNPEFALLAPGELVGLVVDLLDLGALPDAEKLKPSASSTTKRYYAGDPGVSAEKEAEILRLFSGSIAALISADGVWPGLRAADLQVLVETVVAHAAAEWGAFVAFARGVAPHDRPDLLVQVVLRLVTIDMALRSVAITLLGGTRSDASQFSAPWWLAPDGRAHVLRTLIDEATARDTWKSREAFAESLGVEDTELDRWLDGVHRPEEKNLRTVAGGFTHLLPPTTGDQLLARMRWQYGLCEIRSRLVEAFGDEFVKDCSAAWSWIQRRVAPEFDSERVLRSIFADGVAHPLVNPADPLDTTRIEAAAREQLAAIACEGTSGSAGAALAEQIARDCPRPIWRTELARVGGPWLARVREVAQHLVSADVAIPALMRELGISEIEARALHAQCLPIMAAVDETIAPGGFTLASADSAFRFDQTKPDHEGLRRALEEGRVVRIVGDDRFKARNRGTLFQRAAREHRVDDALEHGERMIALMPNDAEHQYQFGAFLSEIGDADRALDHLRIAVHLDPQWDRPCVEIVVVLENAERRDEALAHAEREIPALAHPTDVAWYTLGRIRRLSGKPREALDALERALKLNPDHPYAILDAMWACEELGDKSGAKTYERRARKLGLPIPRS